MNSEYERTWIFNDLKLLKVDFLLYMGQITQEWTKKNLWKTAFKLFEGAWSALADHILQNFQRLSSTNFTWSILEYFVPCMLL